MKQEVMTVEEYRREIAGTGGHVWGHAKAKPGTLDGIRFRSATEARVYRRLKLELREGEGLAVHVRLPIWRLLGPISRPLRSHYYEADFVVWSPAVPADQILRIIDAKPKGFDRDGTAWRRTKAAVESSYGIRVEVASE